MGGGSVVGWKPREEVRGVGLCGAAVLWTQSGLTIQGVRLDRVRGGRQKYKRRPEVDPLPFPGPFPAGPLAVAGGPRKTGEILGS